MSMPVKSNVFGLPCFLGAAVASAGAGAGAVAPGFFFGVCAYDEVGASANATHTAAMIPILFIWGRITTKRRVDPGLKAPTPSSSARRPAVSGGRSGHL